MRSAALLLALASTGAWAFVPSVRLAPARAAVQRRANGLRMDAGEGAPPKLAKIENLKVGVVFVMQ